MLTFPNLFFFSLCYLSTKNVHFEFEYLFPTDSLIFHCLVHSFSHPYVYIYNQSNCGRSNIDKKITRLEGGKYLKNTQQYTFMIVAIVQNKTTRHSSCYLIEKRIKRTVQNNLNSCCCCCFFSPSFLIFPPFRLDILQSKNQCRKSMLLAVWPTWAKTKNPGGSAAAVGPER